MKKRFKEIKKISIAFIVIILVLFVFNLKNSFAATATPYYQNKNFSSSVGGIGDPFIIYDNGYYYLYGTGLMNGKRTKDFVTWSKTSDSTSYDTTNREKFWAPEVFKYDDYYYKVFSSFDKSTGISQIGIASSTNINSSFKVKKYNLLSGKFSASVIDADILIDDEKQYLYFVKDQANQSDGTKVSSIYGVQIKLKDGNCEVVGDVKLLKSPTATWEKKSGPERYWNEGPSVIKHGSRYYLMYSANYWASSYYSVGYVYSDNGPLGPYTTPKSPILLQSTTNSIGPGHNSVFKSATGELYTAYHVKDVSKSEETGEWRRTLAIDRIDFNEGRLFVNGPTYGTTQLLPSGVNNYTKATPKTSSPSSLFNTLNNFSSIGGSYTVEKGKTVSATFSSPKRIKYIMVYPGKNVSSSKDYTVTISINGKVAGTKNFKLNPSSTTSISLSGNYNVESISLSFSSSISLSEVAFISDTVKNITINTKPTKLTYIQNYDSLSVSGGKINVNYNNTSTPRVVSMTSSMISGFDNTKVGTKTLKVTYGDYETSYNISIVKKSVASLEVYKDLTKTSYIQNYESLKLAGGKIKVIYNDKTSKIINMSDCSVTGFDNSKVGTNTITIKYGNKTVTYKVNIESPSLSSISVSKGFKKDYVVKSEELDVSNGVLKLVYNDKSTETVDIKSSMVSGFDNSKTGEQTLTITYKGKTTTYTINIIKKIVSSISISTKPTKLTYIKNYEKLDVSGGKIKVVYNDKSTETVDIKSSMVSGFDNSKTGEQTLTVSYGAKTTSYKVNIENINITSIKVTTLPTKTSYIEDYDDLDLTGGKLTVYYNNNKSKVIDLKNASVSGFSNSSPGKINLTVTYSGKTTTFSVTIVQKTITSIKMQSLPYKVNYTQNYDNLNLAGATIVITYNTLETKIKSITSSMVSGFNNKVLGENTITVKYSDNITSKTTSFKVNIVEKQVKSISVSKLPAKIYYIENYDSLDVTGGEISVKYNDNSSKVINMSNKNIEFSNYDNSSLGTNNIIVTYEGKTTSFDVNIVEKQVKSISLYQKFNKLNYIKNYDKLDVTGGKIEAIYDDTSKEIINITKDMVSGYDNSQIGTNKVKISYQNCSVYMDLNIVEKQIQKIEINSLPTKVDYLVNKEDLDLTGSSIKVIYDDKSTEIISITNAMVSGFNNSKKSTNYITVKYGGFTTKFGVNIVSEEVKSIKITSKPSKLTYIQNYDKLSTDGGVIEVFYENGETETMDITDNMVSGFKNDKTGTITLTVSYYKKSDTYDVEIVSKKINKMYISSLPKKLKYIKNYDKLDLNGGKITVLYNDSSSDIIDMDESMISGFNNSAIGTNTLTVDYDDYQDMMNVTIEDKSLTSLTINTEPLVNVYAQNSENLNMTGCSLTAVYNDLTSEEVSVDNDMVSNFDTTNLGTNILSINYRELSVPYAINVVSKTISNIQMNELPSKIKYYQGLDYLDLSDGSILVNYTDGTSDIVELDSELVNVTGYSNLDVGTIPLQVKYDNFTTSYSVDIVPLEKSINKIEVYKLPDKTKYVVKYDALNLDGAMLKVTYNDNSFEYTKILDAMVSDFDNSTVGTEEVVVEYGDFSTSFDVDIVPKSASKIEVETMPNKTSYKKNSDSIDLTGGKIHIYYNNNTDEIIDMDNSMVSNFDSSILGSYVVNLNYGGQYTSFNINIVLDSTNDSQSIYVENTFINKNLIIILIGAFTTLIGVFSLFRVINLSDKKKNI